MVARLLWETDLIHSGHFSKTSNTPLTLRIFGLWDFRKNRQKWQRPHSIPQTLKIPQKLHIGMWRSLVSRSLWEREISQVRILSSRPTLRTEKDIGSENPETTRFLGFFVPFFKVEFKRYHFSKTTFGEDLN